MANKPQDHPNAAAKNLVCGMCQWFGNGLNGEDCQKTRAVAFTSTACVEYSSPSDNLYHACEQDKLIREARTQLQKPTFRLSDTILDELRGYVLDPDLAAHPFGTQAELNELVASIKKIVAYRARVATIYSTLVETEYNFQQLFKQAEAQLYSHYATIRNLKNDTQREAAINKIIPEVLTIRTRLKKMLATATYVDEKLKETEGSLRSVLSVSEKLFFSRDPTLRAPPHGR
jgi:hypothetical protein